MSSIFGPDVAYQTYAPMIFQKINQESIDLAFEHLEYEGNLGKFVGWLLKNTSIDWSLYPTIESLCASDTAFLPMLANAPVMYALCLKSSYALAIATASLMTVTRRMALFNSDPALIRLHAAGAGAPFVAAGVVYNRSMNLGAGSSLSLVGYTSPNTLVAGAKYLAVSAGSSGTVGALTFATLRSGSPFTTLPGAASTACTNFAALMPIQSADWVSWTVTSTSYLAYFRLIRCDA